MWSQGYTLCRVFATDAGDLWPAVCDLHRIRIRSARGAMQARPADRGIRIATALAQAYRTSYREPAAVKIRPARRFDASRGNPDPASPAVRLPPAATARSAGSRARGRMTDSAPLTPPPLVLVANDQEWSARSLESILAPNGYAVLRAYTGQHALERARSARPGFT